MTLVNNASGSRTYVDLGAQAQVGDRFTLFGNVNNILDVAPPISTVGNPHYNVMGTYFTVGARALLAGWCHGLTRSCRTEFRQDEALTNARLQEVVVCGRWEERRVGKEGGRRG